MWEKGNKRDPTHEIYSSRRRKTRTSCGGRNVLALLASSFQLTSSPRRRTRFRFLLLLLLLNCSIPASPPDLGFLFIPDRVFLLGFLDRREDWFWWALRDSVLGLGVGVRQTKRWSGSGGGARVEGVSGGWIWSPDLQPRRAGLRWAALSSSCPLPLLIFFLFYLPLLAISFGSACENSEFWLGVAFSSSQLFGLVRSGDMFLYLFCFDYWNSGW